MAGTTALTLGMAVATEEYDGPPGESGTRWLVDDRLTQRLAERAVAWLRVDDPTATYVGRGSWTALTTGLPPVPSLAEAAAEPRSSTRCQVHRSRPFRQRSVTFERNGRLSIQDVDRTRPASDQLALLLESVHWEPQAIDYAFVTHEFGGAEDVWMGGYVRKNLPGGLSEPDIRYHRTLLTSFVPDAFGVQVLNDEHLGRASNLDNWNVDEIAPGRYLVTARDLDPWLSVPPPHPDNRYCLAPPPELVLGRARADFGSMILTREVISSFDRS